MPADRPQRSDAAGNRERILTAARALLDESGELRLNAVAKAAGVGQGTLYRHFPHREALLVEVYRADVDELVGRADVLLREHEPFTALSRWFDQVGEYSVIKRGVLAALDPDAGAELTSGSLGSITEALVRLLEAGQADGSVRADVDAADVLRLLTGLLRVPPAEARERSGRLLSIVLTGLRA